MGRRPMETLVRAVSALLPTHLYLRYRPSGSLGSIPFLTVRSRDDVFAIGQSARADFIACRMKSQTFGLL